MTVRTTFAAVLVAGLAVAAAPANAAEPRTYQAWGHTFEAPDQLSAQIVLPAGRVGTRVTAAPVAPARAYTAGGTVAAREFAPAEATRTLNVWGARLDAPTR
ncbi:hypothetical protein ACLBWX_18010 [Methylobacterium sp. M6A4_1b]